MDDLRASLHQFYEFLKSYDYIEATTRVKSALYDQAVSMMQRGDADKPQAASEGDSGAAAAE